MFDVLFLQQTLLIKRLSKTLGEKKSVVILIPRKHPSQWHRGKRENNMIVRMCERRKWTLNWHMRLFNPWTHHDIHLTQHHHVRSEDLKTLTLTVTQVWTLWNTHTLLTSDQHNHKSIKNLLNSTSHYNINTGTQTCHRHIQSGFSFYKCDLYGMIFTAVFYHLTSYSERKKHSFLDF